jgi:hypothetical protein
MGWTNDLALGWPPQLGERPSLSRREGGVGFMFMAKYLIPLLKSQVVFSHANTIISSVVAELSRSTTLVSLSSDSSEGLFIKFGGSEYR